MKLTVIYYNNFAASMAGISNGRSNGNPRRVSLKLTKEQEVMLETKVVNKNGATVTFEEIGSIFIEGIRVGEYPEPEVRAELEPKFAPILKNKVEVAIKQYPPEEGPFFPYDVYIKEIISGKINKNDLDLIEECVSNHLDGKNIPKNMYIKLILEEKGEFDIAFYNKWYVVLQEDFEPVGSSEL